MTEQAKKCELIPCPFCGLTDSLRVLDENEINEWEEFLLKNPWYAVLCCSTKEGCGATGGYRETEVEAVVAWNMRR